MPIAHALLIEAISIGLVFSLLFAEVLGLSTGGMIVPGYLALELHEPLRVLGTVVVSLLTFGFVRFLSNYAFIYGRRRTVMILLTGFLLGQLSHHLLRMSVLGWSMDFTAIGYMVPGLIADWMERQGIVYTLSAMTIAAALVRLALILATAGMTVF